MKNKKRLLLFIGIFITSLFTYMNVFAQEKTSIHINKNGVELTEKEFQFVNQFYGDSYFEKMTQDDYEWIQDLDVNNRDVEITTVYDTPNTSKQSMLKGAVYSTSYKRLSISRTCTQNFCTVITNLTWLADPNVRSWDVIGARFYNTSLVNDTITTRIYSSNGVTYSSNHKYLVNGIGTSVKLPSGASNLAVDQKFYTHHGGTIYASYQHATVNTTLPISTYYTMGPNGYGSVFNFYSNAIGVYDGMAGVNAS